MQSVQIKRVDQDYRNHLQAFLNFAVKAEKKAGRNKSRPVYRKFKKFYDYEKELERATHKNSGDARFSELSKFLKKRE